MVLLHHHPLAKLPLVPLALLHSTSGDVSTPLYGSGSLTASSNSGDLTVPASDSLTISSGSGDVTTESYGSAPTYSRITVSSSIFASHSLSSGSVVSSPVSSPLAVSGGVLSSAVSTVSSSASSGVPSACDFNLVKLSSGFKATFYDYELDSKSAVEVESFYESGYQTYGVLTSVSGVTDVTIDSQESSKGSIEGTVYGQTVSISNFVVELTGYFRASTSGTYTFTLSNIDDGAGLFIGSAAFDCCESGTGSTASGSPLVFTYKPSDSSASTVSGSVYLESGSLYPIKIVYVNVHQKASLNVDVSVSGGEGITLGSNHTHPMRHHQQL
ncbi:unnamed protein product [Ambrosiozyma monospora]|uniref:Unnamed protein product n=1 Tax=Ambrosiozyma monospora TaxID=43982 RepID=A0ACB5SZ66_AMBMO|nr:unnamed protein product [Ambrosiozyma monospora]